MAALSQGPRANLASLVSYIYRTFARTFTRKPLAFMASAAPYMALGALIFAGAEGIAKKLGLPKTGGEAQPLPRSLGQALDGMEKSAAIKGWFGPTFLEAYLRHSALSSPLSPRSSHLSSAPAMPRSIELGPRASTHRRSRACGNSP